MCCRLISGAMSLPPMMSTTWIVTIRDEFHGTALSAPNHLSRENQGEQRTAIQANFSDKSVPELPNSYALIHPVEMGKNPVFVPRSIISQVRPSHSLVQGAKMNDELGRWHMSTRCYSTTLFQRMKSSHGQCTTLGS